MFFSFNNYIQFIEENNQAYIDIFLVAGKDQSHDEGTERALIMTLVCIVSTLLVLLAFSPITLKIRRSKYQVLLFFVDLEKNIVEECQKKS